jgi:outer membrane protein OmpA-like peptidoglycan-associated protein
MLTQTAKWLNRHPNARILIVGLCDPTGSEGCRRSLAQKRGKVVRDFLLSQSVREAQIEAVLGWEVSAEPCRAAAETCQKLNRTTRVFVASAMASGREDDGNRK